MKKILLLFLIVTSVACSPVVTTKMSQLRPPAGPEDPVVVILDHSDPPENSELLGTVKVMDTGFTRQANYANVILLAMEEVRRAGGNYLRIDYHEPPDVVSYGHTIHASIYSVYDPVNVDEPKAHNIQGMDKAYFKGDFNENIKHLPYRLNKIRWALDIGYAYRPGTISECKLVNIREQYIDEIIKKLSSGVSYGISAAYFIKPYFGIGAKFEGNHFECSHRSLYNVINTYYIGPEVLGRLPTRSRRNAWILGLSLGYASYKETAKSFRDYFVDEGTLKGTAQIGFDLRLGQHMFLGISLTASFGSISYNYLADQKIYKESISTIGIGGGLRF